MAVLEALDLPWPFPGQQRANRIDQAPTGADQFRGNIQQPLLGGTEMFEPPRGEPPPAFRVAPPRPASRAWRIDEDQVRLGAPFGQLFQLARRAQQARFDRRCGPLRARGKLGQAGAIAVGGEDRRFGRGGSKRKRLASRPGAQGKVQAATCQSPRIQRCRRFTSAS